jgi:hypothetical protein
VNRLLRIFLSLLVLGLSVLAFARQMHMQSLESDATSQLSPRVANEVQFAFSSARASLGNLNNSATQLSPDAMKSVNEAIYVFNDAATRLNAEEYLDEKDAEKLQGAAADLRIKADWFKQDKSLDPMVNVTVNTTDKKGKPQPNCEVWYVTAFYKGVSDREAKFDKLSTPTSKKLMPGAYVMWTATLSGKKGNPKPVGVGDNRVSEMSVDLPAPR